MMLHVYRALIRLLPRRVRERDMVSLERRSLGIRLALGATPRSLERGVLANGVRLELDSRAVDQVCREASARGGTTRTSDVTLRRTSPATVPRNM